jgi:hypothetical protein
MEDFWSIVSRWDGLGQGVFFLLVIGGFFALIKQLSFYIAVAFHGWPPQGTPLCEDDDED